MALTAQDTRKVARLSRIRLDDAEVEHFTSELNGIIHWIEQLQEVNTQGVEQMTSVANITLPLRKDVVSGGGQAEAVVANAPASEHGCFVVPKVIE